MGRAMDVCADVDFCERQSVRDVGLDVQPALACLIHDARQLRAAANAAERGAAPHATSHQLEGTRGDLLAAGSHSDDHGPEHSAHAAAAAQMSDNCRWCSIRSMVSTLCEFRFLTRPIPCGSTPEPRACGRTTAQGHRGITEMRTVRRAQSRTQARSQTAQAASVAVAVFRTWFRRSRCTRTSSPLLRRWRR